MAARTQEELEKRIAQLKAAGMSADFEEAELNSITPAGPVKRSAAVAARVAPKVATKIPLPKPEPEEGGVFIPVNLDSFRRGGAGWISPGSTGWFNAICRGILIPDFVEDQCWFLFENPEDADEQFRGSLVCGPLTAEEKSGAWKVKDVLEKLGAPYHEDEERGGVVIETSLEGLECQVDWEDVTIKNKTQRRIQDVASTGSIEQAV